MGSFTVTSFWWFLFLGSSSLAAIFLFIADSDPSISFFIPTTMSLYANMRNANMRIACLCGTSANKTQSMCSRQNSIFCILSIISLCICIIAICEYLVDSLDLGNITYTFTRIGVAPNDSWYDWNWTDEQRCAPWPIRVQQYCDYRVKTQIHVIDCMEELNFSHRYFFTDGSLYGLLRYGSCCGRLTNDFINVIDTDVDVLFVSSNMSQFKYDTYAIRACLRNKSYGWTYRSKLFGWGKREIYHSNSLVQIFGVRQKDSSLPNFVTNVDIHALIDGYVGNKGGGWQPLKNAPNETLNMNILYPSTKCLFVDRVVPCQHNMRKFLNIWSDVSIDEGCTALPRHDWKNKSEFDMAVHSIKYYTNKLQQQGFQNFGAYLTQKCIDQYYQDPNKKSNSGANVILYQMFRESQPLHKYSVRVVNCHSKYQLSV
eukprot:158570_1